MTQLVTDHIWYLDFWAVNAHYEIGLRRERSKVIVISIINSFFNINAKTKVSNTCFASYRPCFTPKILRFQLTDGGL